MLKKILLITLILASCAAPTTPTVTPTAELKPTVPSPTSTTAPTPTLAAPTSTSAPTTAPSPTPTRLTLPTLVPTATPDPSIPFLGTLLISDAGNNRLIEVTVDKKIVWSFPKTDYTSFPPGRTFYYPDDAFFSPDFKYIVVNEAPNHVISIIDYEAKKLVWEYGEAGVLGHDIKHLNTPDDARLLADGRVAVTDIRNCRILIISWDKKDVKQIGTPSDCSGKPGTFGSPNGVFQLKNGNLVITEITTHRVSEMDLNGNIIRTVKVPLVYPSDAYPTPRDTLIIADYIKGGKVYEFDWSGKELWSYPPVGSKESLDRSSIAGELPNGNIIIVDDHQNRVIIVNRKGEILWQYGEKNNGGSGANRLFTPDGIDWRWKP